MSEFQNKLSPSELEFLGLEKLIFLIQILQEQPYKQEG